MTAVDEGATLDEEAQLRVLREQLEKIKEESHVRERKRVQSGLRWGLISITIGAGLWLLSYTSSLPQGLGSMLVEVRPGCVFMAGAGFVITVLNFLSLRARQSGTKRAERQFQVAIVVFGTAIVIAVCLAEFALVDLVAILLSPTIGLPEPDLLFVNGGFGLGVILVGGWLYLRGRTKAKRLQMQREEAVQVLMANDAAFERAWRWPMTTGTAFGIAWLSTLYLRHFLDPTLAGPYRWIPLALLAGSLLSVALMLLSPALVLVAKPDCIADLTAWFADFTNRRSEARPG